MTNYIPDEIFNRIEYPIHGLSDTNTDGIIREIIYKIPKLPDVIAKKEAWHAVCDFCSRTGALIEKMNGDADIEISPVYGEFLRVVGCGDANGKHDPYPWADSLSQAGNPRLLCDAGTTGNWAVVSSVPRFDDLTLNATTGAWNPKLPRYLLDRYGECLMHGTLMRIFAMTHQPWANVDLARMHAVAYNNDLNRLSFGLITSGMRKHLLIDVEDFLIQANNGNG